MTRNARETHNELLRDPEVTAEYLKLAQEDGSADVKQMATHNVDSAIREISNNSRVQPEVRPDMAWLKKAEKTLVRLLSNILNTSQKG